MTFNFSRGPEIFSGPNLGGEMNLGAQKFFRYIIDNASSYRRAGEELGIHYSAICRMARGERKPDLAKAHKIARWSNGEIKPEDWIKKERKDED